MRAPEALAVVPAVVQQERVDLRLPLDDQFFAEAIDGVDGLGGIEAAEVADVVPGVVVQERAVGMGPLAFEVGKEAAAQLALGHKADDRGDFKPFARLQGRAARQETADMPNLAPIDRHRMLYGEERRVGHHRRAVDAAAAAGGGQRNVDEEKLLDRDRLLNSLEGDLLAEVWRAFAEDCPPCGRHVSPCVAQFGDELLCPAGDRTGGRLPAGQQGPRPSVRRRWTFPTT